MYKSIYFLLIIILLNACGSNDDANSSSLSTLIKPNFTYKQDFFNCNLNNNNSLINLESFFSKVVEEYKINKSQKFNLSILFPNASEEVSSFIISISSNSNHLEVLKFIEKLEEYKFDDIASCTFSIYQRNALDLINISDNVDNDFTLIEILRCEYNDDSNYGTFKIAIDRFVNKIVTLNIPYSLSYLEDNTTSRGFIWINYFYSEDYKDFLSTNWINEIDSSEIKEEFVTNAVCSDSRGYRAFKLL